MADGNDDDRKDDWQAERNAELEQLEADAMDSVDRAQDAVEDVLEDGGYDATDEFYGPGLRRSIVQMRDEGVDLTDESDMALALKQNLDELFMENLEQYGDLSPLARERLLDIHAQRLADVLYGEDIDPYDISDLDDAVYDELTGQDYE